MTRLVVDEKNQLKESNGEPVPEYPTLIQLLAKIISYIFHPLFIPVYISWFLVRLQPYLFVSFSESGKIIVIIRFFVIYSMLPLVTVLLAKGLGFVSSVYLHTQRDRIIPYVICGIYYFWMWYVLRNQPEFPDSVVWLSLAIFIASSLGLLANIYMKVSMHAISAGIMSTFVALLAFNQSVNFGIYISLALLITGLVCTARFIASDHTQKEIYGGLLIGIVSQLIAYVVYNHD